MMRKHKIIVLLLLVVMVLIPIIAYANLGTTMYRPLGGRVIAFGGAASAVITCTATYGPMFIQSFVPTLPGPYFIRSGLSGAPRNGGYILGLYRQIADTGTCFNTETGAPIPAYEIKPQYGVSR